MLTGSGYGNVSAVRPGCIVHLGQPSPCDLGSARVGSVPYLWMPFGPPQRVHRKPLLLWFKPVSVIMKQF